jgi:hypothetical protein
MTDISTIAPATIRRFNLLRPRHPRLAFGASLGAMFGVMCEAHRMAIVDPFSSLRRQPKIPDDEIEGRDPTW